MYNCYLHIYLTGRPCRTFEVIKEMPALEHFTHIFTESDKLEANLISEADVIIVDLQDMDIKEVLPVFKSGGGKETQVILLADKEQMQILAECQTDGTSVFDGTSIFDGWVVPMSEEEVRFRFARWQQTYKMSKDFWQTSHYLEATINNIPNLVWYKDKNGIHEKVNDSFCKTVNKTKQQVEGRGHAYIWDVEQDDPACIESEREVMEKKQTCVSEEIIKTGDGMRTLTTYKSPLYNLDGSVMGTVGVAIDVTQERAYEQEIIKKNQTLETIFTTIDCGVIRHTTDGRHILSINRPALKILGYKTQEELIADGFLLIAPTVVDEDKIKLTDSLKKLIKVGDSVNIEYRIQHKDGELLHVMGNIKLLEENGERFYQRFLLDCTAQKLQEKKNERRQLELIQALSIDYSLVCLVDPNTGMVTPIQNADQKTGDFFRESVALTDIMEQYIQRWVYEDDRDMLRQATSLDTLKKELSEKKLYHVNYRKFMDNEIIYFQIKVVGTETDDGDSGIVLGFRSVDEEVRREMEQNNLLEAALSQANRASKAKSVFLSNMSHDIRTPMNAIVGFTNLAITHIDQQEKVEEYLQKIMTSGNHLLSLINDVLDMSRIESGKMQLDEKPCSLPDILHGLRNILQADIRAKQLDLQIDTIDVLDENIYCDKLRLNQVLLNLLSNSVKYTGPGGTVSMRITEQSGAPKGYANYEFCIRDNGIGMSPEFVQHIFEPFEREQNSTISKIQGTGLGMAITKNIVDMMNGFIEVKSEQGQGSEFTVVFTFRLCSEANTVQTIPELINCRALVVDDDFNTCDSVSYMLGQLGLRAEWTLSGKEAVLRTHQAIMREDDYSVYIVDWLLPDINGIEVIRRIRKETGENVPMIVLTAYDWSDIETEAREAGVTAFCSKPLFLSELRSCLLSVVHSQQDEISPENTAQETIKHHTGRILLVEDVELNQEIAVAILGDAGFTTEVAENGKIAVDMVKQSEPGYYNVVLMDVQMPVMNGYEAARAIRSLENKALSSIPIIAMTANAFEEDKQAALQCGMNGHIAKPIDIQQLFQTLDSVL
ncbi:MAG: response regulator [Lachnoclostridium sp.]|nr:response regulator [Lachnospira sp.]MCM1249072.1 response regulator [Lachnoclostridium sp.]MCM1535799.1 response regulator [Clostridium sp.]